MAYTSLAQIKSMFRGITIASDTGDESTNTVITTEDVTQFIADADAEIDARISDYYTTPVTGTEALKYLNVISKYKVAHIINGILHTDSERDINQESSLGVKADKLLESLAPQFKNNEWVDPKVQLTDAARTQRGPKSGSTFGINYSGVRTPTIKKGGGNW